MLPSPDTIQRLSFLRNKARTEELPIEEYREALMLMRQGRVGAAQASTASRAKKAPVDVAGLLSELESL